MIISASRRTDIPAFYAPWLLNRLSEGFVDVQNPMNAGQFFRVPLSKESVTCLAFWTKNPLPMLEKGHGKGSQSLLDRLDSFGLPYFFQFTLTPYTKALEANLPSKDTLCKAFIELSRRLGKERVVWRYDPVVFTGAYSPAWHAQEFSRLAELLSGFTEHCIFSFVSVYKKFSRATVQAVGDGGTVEARESVVRQFVKSATRYGMSLSTCCDAGDYHCYGVQNTGCFNPAALAKVVGGAVEFRRDKNQRLGCNCMESIDIGAYDSCLHGCIYCYATKSANSAREKAGQHDPKSSVLIGHLPEGVAPRVRILRTPQASPKEQQLSLFGGKDSCG